MNEQTKLFTYEEVKEELCEACRLKIPDVWDGLYITHFANGVAIPCAARIWRMSRKVHEKAFPNELSEIVQKPSLGVHQAQEALE